MVNTKIRLIIFFAAKDGEALYSQQKQDMIKKLDISVNLASAAAFSNQARASKKFFFS